MIMPIPEQNAAWLSSTLLQQSPLAIAVMDRQCSIIVANDNFTRDFGPWLNRKCYQVYKKTDVPSHKCDALLF